MNPTLPQLLRSRTAAFLARHSHLVALALFAVVGVLVLDDYGVPPDEDARRGIGRAALDYMLGVESAPPSDAAEDAPPSEDVDFRAAGFDIPLAAAERFLDPEDSRAIYLSRHLITHLFFLAGGFFAWLLAYRLFGNRAIALLAMMLFLLHPRIYAHSFFNSEDPPFLSAFMVALYLVHRAFRRDTVWAFALCGAGVGLLMSVRAMGVILLPAVLGMLALDAVFAARRGGWKMGIKPALANAAALIAAFAAALYAASPALWRDPTGLADSLQGASAYPSVFPTLFRGEWVWWPNIPWDYIPAWMLITAPPAALALAALGVFQIARLCAARWRDMFADSAARFGLLAVVCLILPIAAAAALDFNLREGWRQMYFLYAPLCVLAAFGLRALASLPKPRLRAAALALAAVGIAAVAVQMVSLRPIQSVYFNPLVAKDGIADRWEMIYWDMHYREALEAMLELQPAGTVVVTFRDHLLVEGRRLRRNASILPEEDRRAVVNSRFPSFRLAKGNVGGAAVWERSAYGVPLISIIDLRAESGAAFGALYDAARALPPAANAGGFDIYRDGSTLLYAKENCEPEDRRGTFHLTTIASQRLDSPPGALRKEWASGDFWSYGGTFGGKCLITVPLPEYPIHSVEIEQRRDDGETPIWQTAIIFADSLDDYAAALSALPSAPDASAGGFDIYRKDGTLTYVKRQCSQDDARGRFYLSVFPSNPADLPQAEREAGREHQALNFDFHRYGATLGGDCVIIRDLPAYPISRMETGHWIPGEGDIWSAQILLEEYEARFRRALSALPSAAPAASAGGFDIYLDDGTLTYAKSPCSQDDARGRFYLSIFPSDPADLPQAAREAGRGHESLNFDFPEHGAIFDGKCAIIRNLPNYAISRVETGQWIPNEGGLWDAEIVIGGQ